MRNLASLSLLAALFAFGTQQGQAQQVVCGGDYACIPHDSQALQPDKSPAATQGRCLDAPVEVTAALPDERSVACSAAQDAVRLLEHCGISLRRPLNVHVVGEVRHPLSGPIFGLFDTKQERVLVTREANIPSLVKDTPWAELPLRDFYKSLIVHEVVHGVMHQNYKRRPSSHAAHEYPAYALQIESLPSGVREKFLQSIPNRASKDEFVFNDSILFFDPFFFAAHAYEHLTASANRCALLAALLHGEPTFIPATSF